MTELVAIDDVTGALQSEAWDAVVLVATSPGACGLDALDGPIATLYGVDQAALATLSVIAADGVPGRRLVVSPTGALTHDYDDVRRFADAAAAGVTRARDAGATRPLLVVGAAPADPTFARAGAVAALAALGALWQPLEAREAAPGSSCEPVTRVGVAVLGRGGAGALSAELAVVLNAVEQGRRLARDLAGTEPERMAPPRFADHCVEAFAGTAVQIAVVQGDELVEQYPLVAAVARASAGIPRHQPRIVRLEYAGEGPIERSYFFAGKGVTYDTGGADIKADGHMAGMSRDKGGAAAVAGFMSVLAALRPRGVRVVAELGLARNSIGADSFVADEIIRSHAGVRVRIGNTDAEGRLVMADLLSHLRERALTEPSPHLFTVATLTGHAVRAVGLYSIAIDNGPARAANMARRLSEVGDEWGDPFEVSRLRREDWDFVKPRSKADDVLSCNNAPSSATARGHQFPMAFLAISSGLAAHSQRDSDRPLPYTHLDIAGSAVAGGDWQHGAPTGAPVVALVATLLGA